jgi:hypothetical protein
MSEETNGTTKAQIVQEIHSLLKRITNDHGIIVTVIRADWATTRNYSGEVTGAGLISVSMEATI